MKSAIFATIMVLTFASSFEARGRPNGGNRRPNSGKRRPDGGKNRPDGGNRRPDEPYI